MAHIKNALIRYRIIDKMLNNQYRPFPSKLDMRRACEAELYGSDDGRHISDSTIEKDLYAMRQDFEAPIKYSKLEKGYYYDAENFTINEMPLSEDDISSIQFALNTLSKFKETEMFQQFGFALNKIIDKFAVDSKNQNYPSEEIIQFEQGTASYGNEYLTPLFNAIKNQYITYFYYESFISQQRKMRKVTPLLLKEYNNRWYLISYDMLRETIITYALDRMDELDVTELKGPKPNDFRPDLFFKHSVGITASNDEWPVKVVFKAGNVASKYIQTQPFHQSQKIVQESDQETKFELSVLISEELIRNFMSYGGDIVVLEPAELKEEIEKRVEQMRKNYNL